MLPEYQTFMIKEIFPQIIKLPKKMKDFYTGHMLQDLAQEVAEKDMNFSSFKKFYENGNFKKKIANGVSFHMKQEMKCISISIILAMVKAKIYDDMSKEKLEKLGRERFEELAIEKLKILLSEMSTFLESKDFKHITRSFMDSDSEINTNEYIDKFRELVKNMGL